MLILVSGATKTVKRLEGHPNLGVLITPQTGNTPPEVIPWAADNAAFSNWNPDKFLRLLDKMSGDLYNPPMWVACPDVVGDARATHKLFRMWEPNIRMHGLQVALVVQNGQAEIGIPWNDIDAIFIGGDDEFKLGSHVRWLVGEAKKKDKLVHMGRVNSFLRMDYARNIGCDSIDGTAVSRFSETYLPKFLRHLETEQLSLGDYYSNKPDKLNYDLLTTTNPLL